LSSRWSLDKLSYEGESLGQDREQNVCLDDQFLCTTAATAVAHLSHHNSVCPSICLSVTRVDQSKTVQARVTKFSPSAAWKTLVSGSVNLFHKFERDHAERGC